MITATAARGEITPAPTVDFILSDWHHILFYAPLLITATTVKKILL